MKINAFKLGLVGLSLFFGSQLFGAAAQAADSGVCKPTSKDWSAICNLTPGQNGFDPAVYCTKSNPNSPNQWIIDNAKLAGLCNLHTLSDADCKTVKGPGPFSADFLCEYSFSGDGADDKGFIQRDVKATAGETSVAEYQLTTSNPNTVQLSCENCPDGATVAGAANDTGLLIKLTWPVPVEAVLKWPSGTKVVIKLQKGNQVGQVLFNYTFVPATAATTTPANSITAEYLKGQYPVPEGYDGPLPPCAFSGTCRSTSDLVVLLINAAKFLFSIIGVVAFAAFIYGGFMMIFSFGNSEKVSQGKDAMVAAVVGLIIAFGAYMIINFVLNALGVTAEFRGIIN